MPDPEYTPGEKDLKEQLEKLTMKLDALEEKLSGLHITEDEWKTYEKVSAILDGVAGLPKSVRDKLGRRIIVAADNQTISPEHWFGKIERGPVRKTNFMGGSDSTNARGFREAVGPMLVVRGFADLGS